LEYVHYLFNHIYGLHCVNKERHNNVEVPAILEFKNALSIAEVIIISALAREESRGVHYRDDFPKKDDKHFAAASYVFQMKYNYMKVTFENAVKNNLLYKLKRFFGLY
jgi:succinate dehydrogenase/fumarate reductase flavoprotein subunit